MSELTDFEKKLDELVKSYSYCSGEHQFPNHYSYYEDLRKIMPPTCGVEQRKLLDEIEEISQEEIGLFDLFDIEVDWMKVFKGE
jgi:hypothetical protein